MENRVRDLEQIQERDGDDRGRRLGSLLMAALALVGLTFAIGVVVGRAAEPSAEAKKEDPLAKLERASGVGLTTQAPAPKPAAVRPTDLSFPATLIEQEDRPEVLAALAAAAAEEAALAEAASPNRADVQAPRPLAPDDEAEAHEPASTQTLVARVPAAVAAGSAGRSLPKASRHDSLVASALESDEPSAPSAALGHDGEFTLQVISYDRPEPARAFAAGLRDKGHAAFVTSAEVEDRGRFYRVRVGPFKSRNEADRYRQQFEQQEHMNTFVVRRKDDASH